MNINNNRGIALLIVVISAVIFSLMAIAVLMLSGSKAELAGDAVKLATAENANRSAMVIAYEKLWNEATIPYPPSCTGANVGTTQTTTETVDTGTGLMNVAVAVSDCGACTSTHPTCSHELVFTGEY